MALPGMKVLYNFASALLGCGIKTEQIVLRGCGGGCLGMILLILLMVAVTHIYDASLTPAERAAQKAERDAKWEAKKQKDNTTIDVFLNKFRELRYRLPRPQDMEEQLCPTPLTTEHIDYLAVDYPFVTQFTESGFEPMQNREPHLWYRGSIIQNVQGCLIERKTDAERHTSTLLANGEQFENVPYLAVFVPTSQRWPTLSKDNKTFQPGYFHGWVILVDAKTMKPLGQTHLSAESSSDVWSLRVGIAGVKVGSDIKTVMEDDFTNHFWEAANGAIARLRKREGSTSDATRRDYFISHK
jgi:hypothetical protein